MPQKLSYVQVEQSCLFVVSIVTAIASCLTGQKRQTFWTKFVTLCLAEPVLSDHLYSLEEIERWSVESTESDD